MITLAAASQKGGVAKATTNLAIGAKLVEDGARVLYIDLDPPDEPLHHAEGSDRRRSVVA